MRGYVTARARDVSFSLTEPAGHAEERIALPDSEPAVSLPSYGAPGEPIYQKLSPIVLTLKTYLIRDFPVPFGPVNGLTAVER